MKNMLSILLILFISYNLYAQSGRPFRRYNVMNKNLVSTVYTNGGVIGHPVDRGPRGAWIEDTNGYVGDVSPFVGCEVPYKITPDSTIYFHWISYCLADRRPNDQELSPAGEFWGFEPKDGYFNPSKTGSAVALFTDEDTWPSTWPDRLSDVADPGWPGQWNGFFGKGLSNATEETYFVMDDNQDEEFNNDIVVIPGFPDSTFHFKSDSVNTLRNGMGLEVKVRGLQWKQFLAQDAIFWLYEIKNESTTNYNKATFGMLVGTYIGVTSTEDVNEYNDDWSFFDPELDITYTGDFPDNNLRNPLWQGPVGMVGYAFLESPGNQFDGIDNDNDAEKNFTSASLFEETDFDTVFIEVGSQVVTIDDDFERTIITIGSNDTTVVSQGRSITLRPGITKLVEGNIELNLQNRESVNPNANDGLDNDLDGLIDENYSLHYYKRRQDDDGTYLIDILSPIRHKNYIDDVGLTDLMIDESRIDGIDNDNDWDPINDDVGLDGVPNTADIGENDGLPTSGAGTGLPGEPNIDLTDVDESDQIGLTSFDYFTNSNAPIDLLRNDEAWWDRVAPGQYDVPSSIVNNIPITGEDGDFFYASGYFPLLAGRTERLSLALVYGGGKGGLNKDLEDLLKNRVTVQKIYDSNYRFPKEPDTPTLRAEVGDGKVVLYWDRIAEDSFDPVLKEKDFEGYRLYKSTDAKFNDIRLITDADGSINAYIPLEQWDLKNDVIGYFQGSPDLMNATSGFSWNLGEDTGLQHFYIDTDVENGRTYYYAISAYDRGSSVEDVFPSESAFSVEITSSGEIKTDKNTVAVVPGTNAAGYIAPETGGELNHLQGPGTGSVSFQVIDEKATTGNPYQVEFYDTSNDGIDNDEDWNPFTDDLNGNGIADPNEPNIDLNDPDEFWPNTTMYTVKDFTVYTEEFTIDDSLWVELKKQNLDSLTTVVNSVEGDLIDKLAYTLDFEKGRFRPTFDDTVSVIQLGESFSITYEYYPVYESINIGEILSDESEGILFDTDIFDGTQLSFDNPKQIEVIDDSSGWNRPEGYPLVISSNLVIQNPDLSGRPTPHDFNIEFSDSAVYNSYDFGGGAPSYPVNFKVVNTTLNDQVEFIFNPTTNTLDPNGYVPFEPTDELYFFEKGPNDSLIFTWYIIANGDSAVPFTSGDIFELKTSKPFRNGDVFTFSTPIAVVDQQMAKSELDRIKVVPNPYISAHAHEIALPAQITSGRGERKITFTHLPLESKIMIFTARGDLVATIEPENVGFDGTATWNLKNKDNLDIAFGVYFYVVDSPVGKKRGKIGIIK
jgi:hypothetical protein